CLDFRLGALRGHRWPDDRHEHVWRIGAAEGVAEEIRLHGRCGGRCGQGNAGAEIEMTIVERALELVEDGSTIGLGSGRAAQAFVRALGERVRGGAMRIRGVATSEETAALARQVGVPLVTLNLFLSDNDN